MTAEELLRLYHDEGDEREAFYAALKSLHDEYPREELRFRLLHHQERIERVGRMLKKRKLHPLARKTLSECLEQHREIVASCQKALANQG